MDELYASLAEWKPLDDAKRLDVWLAVNVMGWHVFWGSWGPSWRYRDEAVASVRPDLANHVWTGYWVFDTRVRWEDQKDDAHRVYHVEDGEVRLAYSVGSEWIPTRDEGSLAALKDQIPSLGLGWTASKTPDRVTVRVLKGSGVLAERSGDKESVAFCEAVRDAVLSERHRLRQA